MNFKVFMTNDAAHDLEELYDYLLTHNLGKKADYVLNKIETIVKTLAKSPQRGTYPKELLALGIRDYREIFFKPYRLLYRVIENRVYIYLVVDGRRDMQTLLARRLLDTQ